MLGYTAHLALIVSIFFMGIAHRTCKPVICLRLLALSNFAKIVHKFQILNRSTGFAV